MINLQDKNNPLDACSCGSKIWSIDAMFDNGAISLYFNEMKCKQCGLPPMSSNTLDGGFV